MSEPDFLFALELSDDETHFEAMLNELAEAVLGYAGCASDAVTSTMAGVRRALSAGKGASRCTVRFSARAGTLSIVIDRAGRPKWRTTLPLRSQS